MLIFSSKRLVPDEVQETIYNFEVVHKKAAAATPGRDKQLNQASKATLASIEKVWDKALHINLDSLRYGSICEIGAGQRVAGQFFKVGAAAGTIAKTMSAYDMTVSDEIYGKAPRYVCRERVDQMLDREYSSLQERLHAERGDSTTFFTYAATISAKSYNANNCCHGHIGLRFQHEPLAEPSNINLHVHMLDATADLQAQALGMLGVNLIFGALYFWDEPKVVIEKLLEELSSERIEVDFIEFTGPAFKDVENRLMNLHLLRAWCTRAVLFDENGNTQIPGDRLRKVPVMTIRGSFRPPTRIVSDMFESGTRLFAQLNKLEQEKVLTVTEITMSEVGKASAASDQNFLSRVDLLSTLGHCVLVSDYYRFFRLRNWMRTHNQEPFAITLSVRDVVNLLNPKYYEDLEGGLLEGMGKLFPDDTQVFVYPTIIEGQYTALEDVRLPPNQQSLLDHLIRNRLFIGCKEVDRSNLYINSAEVHQSIKARTDSWKKNVDERLIPMIETREMFTA